MRSVSPIRQGLAVRLSCRPICHRIMRFRLWLRTTNPSSYRRSCPIELALGYPPAVYLIALLVSGTNEKMVRDAAMTWVARLTACASPSVAGHTAAKALRRLNRSAHPPVSLFWGQSLLRCRDFAGRYRWQILVKSLERETGLDAVRITVKDMERTYQRRAIKFDVDVDPIEMW